MKSQFSILKNVDKQIIFIFLAMIFFGWINIYAAEIKESHQSIFDTSQSYGKQLLWIVTALVIAAVILLFEAKFFPAFSMPIFWLIMLLLIGVIVFGTTVNASKSWFRIGGFSIQPAEFAKYATALAIARFVGESKLQAITWPVRFRLFAIIAFPVMLIFLQNDTGTALVFSALVIVLYREGYVSGWILIAGIAAVFLFMLTLLINEFIIIGILAAITLLTAFFVRKKKDIVQLLGLFMLVSAYVYSVNYTFENVLQQHQKLRILVLIDESVDLRGAGYNLHQSKIAIGSGGIMGKGFLKGTQTKLNFVPEQGTDFIFCTIGEEWGFLGSLVTVSLFVWLLIRLVIMAERQRSAFSRVFGYSVASIIFFHFTVNMGMTIGLVPVIGIPLPFFSYGGSSLWAFTIMIFTFLKLDSNRLDLL